MNMRRTFDWVKATLLLVGVALVGVATTTQVDAVVCWDDGHNCHIYEGGAYAHHKYFSA
jgi:hypothetical protein